jgi:hypothetical protein
MILFRRYSISLRTLVLASLLLCVASPNWGAPAPVQRHFEPDLEAIHDTATWYPSLIRRSYVRIIYRFLRDSGRSPDPRVIASPEQLALPSAWVARKIKFDQARKEWVSQGDIPIESVDVTTSPNQAYIFLQRGSVAKGDILEVGLSSLVAAVGDPPTPAEILYRKDNDTPADPSDDAFVQVRGEVIPRYTLDLRPEQVHDQELIGGGKKDLGQLTAKFGIPLVSDGADVSVYFDGDNVLSTDSRDKSAKLDVKLGARRNLARFRYIPGFVEARFLSNQAFTHSSAVISAGVSGNIPWGWARNLLFNSFVKAPVSPELSLGLQYENRLRRDIRLSGGNAQTSVPRVFGQLSWTPIYFDPGKGEESLSASKAISLEVLAKGWWFLDDLNIAGGRTRTTAGQLELTLGVPLGTVNFFNASADAGTVRLLELKYVAGANEGSGFLDSNRFTFGLRLLK